MDEKKKNSLRRRSFLHAAGISLSGFVAGARPTRSVGKEPEPGATLNATLASDLGEKMHELPKTQYGHFIEHLGKCIKGGIWAEGEKPDLFLGGVRPELVEAIRSIHPALIRYPGGCFADGYHWQDGIGPHSSRPRRWNRAWGKLGPRIGPWENNHFGTDEFLQLCAAVGAEPMLTVNVGSGTAPEAAAWVEYCNGLAATRWGREREKNGHAVPYGVKFWFVGNEIFSPTEIGYLTPEEYGKVFRDYSRAMRAVDPGVKLIAVGNHFPRTMASKRDLNRRVLEGTAGEADYLSLHQYTPPFTLKNSFRFQLGLAERSRSAGVYYDILATAEEYRLFLDQCIEDVRKYSPPGRKIPIAFDEWNLWYHFAHDLIRANYNLRDGLWCASVLNLLHRRAPDIPIANIAQMVNCLGIISSDAQATFLTPPAWVFKLYSENAGTHLLRSQVESPPLPHPSQLPTLDASVTASENGAALFLINRHHSSPVQLAGRLQGIQAAAEVKELTLDHPDPVKYNTDREPEAVKPRIQVIKPLTGQSVRETCFSVVLPAHSLTCLVFERASRG